MFVITFARFAAAGSLLVVAAPLAAQSAAPIVDKFLIADRATETALARSAAPSSISDSATVLVLGRTGFVEAAHGTNGFTCVVMRSLSNKLDDPDLYNPILRAPHCFNAAAARTVLPTMLAQTEWMLAGIKPDEVLHRLEHAYAAHDFPSPAPGAMAYMLSPDQHLAANGTHWLPHLMFFFDKSVSPSTWGAGAAGSPVIDGSTGDPHAWYLTLFVVVREWSNGKPA